MDLSRCEKLVDRRPPGEAGPFIDAEASLLNVKLEMLSMALKTISSSASFGGLLLHFGVSTNTHEFLHDEWLLLQWL